MSQPLFIDQETEHLLSLNKQEAIEYLESQWKSGSVISEWYKLVLAVGMSMYPFYDYEVVLSLGKELYLSRYRYHSAIIMASIYKMYPIYNEFISLLHESGSPYCMYSLAEYYAYIGDIDNSIIFAKISQKYTSIPKNIVLLIENDSNLRINDKKCLIDIWNIKTKTKANQISIHTSINICHDYWNVYISGTYMDETTKFHKLLALNNLVK